MFSGLASDNIALVYLVAELHRGLVGNNFQIVFLLQAFQKDIGLSHGLVGHVQHLAGILSGAEPDLNEQVAALAVLSLCRTLPGNGPYRVILAELTFLIDL